jgi:hypothetical protein
MGINSIGEREAGVPVRTLARVGLNPQIQTILTIRPSSANISQRKAVPKGWGVRSSIPGRMGPRPHRELHRLPRKARGIILTTPGRRFSGGNKFVLKKEHVENNNSSSSSSNGKLVITRNDHSDY